MKVANFRRGLCTSANPDGFRTVLGVIQKNFAQERLTLILMLAENTLVRAFGAISREISLFREFKG